MLFFLTELDELETLKPIESGMSERFTKYVIIKLAEEKVRKELGETELANMYRKIRKVYAGVWKMEELRGTDVGYRDEDAYVYAGDLEYQDVIGASIGMEKAFKWMERYTSIWKVFDVDDYQMEDLTIGLLKKQ